MVSEELCLQSVMERQTDGRRPKIYEKYTGYQQIIIQDTYIRCNYMTNLLAFAGLDLYLQSTLIIFASMTCVGVIIDHVIYMS